MARKKKIDIVEEPIDASIVIEEMKKTDEPLAKKASAKKATVKETEIEMAPTAEETTTVVSEDSPKETEIVESPISTETIEEKVEVVETIKEPKVEAPKTKENLVNPNKRTRLSTLDLYGRYAFGLVYD